MMRTSGLARTATIASGIGLAAVLGGGWYWYHSQQVSAETARKYQQLMALTPIDSPPIQAPSFTLKDQRGQTISLHSLRGKTVVLDFMDPVCTDICPIVSQELVEAQQLLGSKAKNVVFLAVNVNQYHESQQDVLAFSKEHGLNVLPNWHFLTGKTPELKAIWKAYGIQVQPNPTGDVVHSSFMFFIDKQGVERQVASPDNSKATISEWAQGIDYVVRQMV